MYLYCSYRVNVKNKHYISDNENVEMKAEIKNLKVLSGNIICMNEICMKSNALLRI